MLDSHFCTIKIFSNLNSQGNEVFKLFSNLRNETLFIADYEYANKFAFGFKVMAQRKQYFVKSLHC